MTKKFLILTLTAAAAVLPLRAQAAAESLYNAQDTKSLGDGAISLFGPRSSGVKYDNRMIRAAQIAQSRARSHSARRCWSYVKTALVQAAVVDSRPETAYAKQAG